LPPEDGRNGTRVKRPAVKALSGAAGPALQCATEAPLFATLPNIPDSRGFGFALREALHIVTVSLGGRYSLREKIKQQYQADIFAIGKLVRMMRYAGGGSAQWYFMYVTLVWFNGGEMDAHYIFSLALVSFVAFLCFKFRKGK